MCLGLDSLHILWNTKPHTYLKIKHHWAYSILGRKLFLSITPYQMQKKYDKHIGSFYICLLLSFLIIFKVCRNRIIKTHLK